MNKIIECVPNYSEGRNLEVIEKIVDCFRAKKNIKLLDYSSDYDHNRMVVTVVGKKDELKEAVLKSVEVARDNIDLRNHVGEHPRMGAVDVIPFIPIKNVTMQECVDLSKEVASEMYSRFGVPSFLYENSAVLECKRNLADLRRGEFENMREKLKTNDYTPDYGKDLHESYGISAVGARDFLIAYNINLDCDDIEIANAIAKRVRYSSGGLRYVKAIGIKIDKKGLVQVSMNCTNYRKTSLYTIFEMVKMEAKRYGVNIIESEVIGLMPMEALVDVAKYYLRIDDFDYDRVIENNFL